MVGLVAAVLASPACGAYPGILPDMQTGTMIVDAIEGEFARVELHSGAVIDLPVDWLPQGVAEGDHLRVEVVGDGRVVFTLDADETERVRRENQALLDSITEEPPEDFHI